MRNPDLRNYGPRHFHFKVSEKMHDRMTKAAEIEEKSIAQLVRDVLNRYLATKFKEGGDAKKVV